MPVAILDDGL